LIEYSDRKSANVSQPRAAGLSVLLEIAWMIAGVALMGLLGGVVAVLVPPLGYVAPLAGLLILVALAALFRSARRKEAMVVMVYLEQAVRQNLPLPAMLAAAERTERGPLRTRLGRLRDALEGGTPLEMALSQTVPGVPRRVLGLVESGERLGRLPHVLVRVVRPQLAVEQPRPLQSIYLRWYPLAMLFVLTAISTAMMLFVIPKFKDILRDFHVPMPPVTHYVIEMYQWLAYPVAIIAAVTLVIFCGRLTGEVIRIPGQRFEMWQWFTDRLAWVTPMWRGVVRNRGLADVCYVMADALDIGQPADLSLSEAGQAASNIVLRKRMEAWSRNVTGGMSLSDAARKAKLPALVVNLLATAHGPDGAKNVFRFLGRYYDSRHSVAAVVLQGAAVPAVAGGFGLIAASIALAMFMPLVELMSHIIPDTRLL
jgi:type II secretory pathway component PulF